eukprot:143932_1
MKYLRKNGQCTEGGEGQTNLYAAIKRAQQLLDHSKTSKFIIISNCKDDHKVCKMAKEIIDVDSYIVNLITDPKGVEVENKISDSKDAEQYLSCLRNEGKADKICIGDGVEAMDRIVHKCLLPEICG